MYLTMYERVANDVVCVLGIEELEDVDIFSNMSTCKERWFLSFLCTDFLLISCMFIIESMSNRISCSWS